MVFICFHMFSYMFQGKKAFKPLNINYTVARGGAPPALGTAQPSSLADLLRQKRSQQAPTVLDTGPPEPARTPWAPAEGLTWAEKVQMSQPEEPALPQGIKLRIRSQRGDSSLEAQPGDTAAWRCF